jgi:hypothetical protein
MGRRLRDAVAPGQPVTSSLVLDAEPVGAGSARHSEADRVA